MMYSIDVNGNDNQPEWGYCTYPGCTHDALPIWLSGEYPDDADLFLCEQHIGSKINALVVILRAIIGSQKETWIGKGTTLYVSREMYEQAWREVLMFGSVPDAER